MFCVGIDFDSGNLDVCDCEDGEVTGTSTFVWGGGWVSLFLLLFSLGKRF